MTETPLDKARDNLRTAIDELARVQYSGTDEEKARDRKAVDLLIEEIKDVRRRIGDVADDLGG